MAFSRLIFKACYDREDSEFEVAKVIDPLSGSASPHDLAPRSAKGAVPT